MAGAAGGFVTRAFESMLKECSGKKYPSLQKAIKSYLDNEKGEYSNLVAESNQVAYVGVEGSSPVEGVSEARHNDVDQSQALSSSANVTEDARQSKPGALSNAGRTIEGAEAELIFNPLQIAFTTKNLKVLELALDCLHKLLAYDHLEGDLGVDGGQNAQLFTDILNMVCSCVEDSSSDSTILLVLKVLLTAVASTKFRVHGEPLVAVIRVCYNIALNSKSPVNQVTSKAMLIQIISIVFRRMETDLNARTLQIGETATLDTVHPANNAEGVSIASVEELQNLVCEADIKGLEAVLDKAVQNEYGSKITKGIDLENMVIGERDALLLFRTLCKMGMKEDSDEVTMKTRILSLELLQGLLEGVDHSFTGNFHFIDSVKAYLAYVLLRASVSLSPVVFQYATGIFSILLLRFRETLKVEIGIFFSLIILRILDGPESPLGHRMSVLRMVEKICKDPQILVDAFVNYDCDLEAPNLFERMVTTLSKITQGTLVPDSNAGSSAQTASAKGSSLQCLVNVLKSLVDWKKSHTEGGIRKRLTDGTASVATEELSDTNGKAVTKNLEMVKAHKCTLEAAISEFNRDPSKGVEYLISNGLVENSPASVAVFLKNTSSLDKAMIGDYLGQHEEFSLAVMNAYVDGMRFSGLKFSTAIREFLQTFRLPGEAQKIDRIMEKFAERYCADNPSLFQSADTAYVLAYSVIMLNTDAHNPAVWPKMSKSDFVRMNSMNDAEESASKELLEEVFDSIVKEEIKMKHDDVNFINSGKRRTEVEERGYLVNILKLTLPKRKSQTDTKSESEAIVKKTQTVLRNRDAKREFYTSHHVELVRPMIEAVGWPLLATFSVIMEEGENKPRIGLCMEGFRAGIYITHVLGMDTMRYAFLTSLVRSTFLHAPKQMRSKNVESLRTLLELCESDSESLQDTWNAVLECVSRLEFIITTPAVAASVMHASNQLSRDAILQNLRELAGKPSEQVFLNSVKLPSDSVVEFFTALCGVSIEELKQNPPRVFGLQKLVEISYYNMARIRMVWARIWSVLSSHFVVAGSHPDEKIAMYAIDSLRQLGMKYLERAELANFSFQNDILKPFVVLIRNSRNKSLRSLIVDSVVQMIKAKVANIKSGWRSVFMIFTAAAADEYEFIVESAFENVEQVILEHFDQVIGDCFMDCVNCLIRFANNKSSHRISLKSIALLRICEDRLAEGFIPGGALKPVDASGDVTFDVTEHYWFPMLAGLSDLTLDSRMEVRNCALEVLFDLLNERGSKFSPSFWESIFHRVLFPIFDHVRNIGKESMMVSDDEWQEEASVHSLQLLCNLFNTFYKEVSFMLPSLLGLLLDCAKMIDQSVVSLSLGALVHLIEVGGHQFSINDWDTLLNGLRDALYITQPVELLNASGFVDYYKGQKNKGYVESGISELSTTNGDVARNSDRGSLASDSRSEGVPKAEAAGGGIQNNQTIRQRLMGNMMDNIFLRSFTSKPRAPTSDVSSPTSPTKHSGTLEPDSEDERDIPLPITIRSKSITQLLLLGAIDCIQRKYWVNLKGHQKVTIMDILLSTLEFAASYNSFTNLRMRMQHIPANRPPLSLLRQELTGTCIYLEVLQKATMEFSNCKKQDSEDTACRDTFISLEKSNDDVNVCGGNGEYLEHVAEEKFVSFCGQVLKEVSDIQSSTRESNNLEIHQVLEFRSPIVVRVLKGMSVMNRLIFRKHLKEFYPWITILVCCEQMDIRRALGDVFNMQLTALLP